MKNLIDASTRDVADKVKLSEPFEKQTLEIEAVRQRLREAIAQHRLTIEIQRATLQHSMAVLDQIQYVSGPASKQSQHYCHDIGSQSGNGCTTVPPSCEDEVIKEVQAIRMQPRPDSAENRTKILLAIGAEALEFKEFAQALSVTGVFPVQEDDEVGLTLLEAIIDQHDDLFKLWYLVKDLPNVEQEADGLGHTGTAKVLLNSLYEYDARKQVLREHSVFGRFARESLSDNLMMMAIGQ